MPGWALKMSNQCLSDPAGILEAMPISVRDSFKHELRVRTRARLTTVIESSVAVNDPARSLTERAASLAGLLGAKAVNLDGVLVGTVLECAIPRGEDGARPVAVLWVDPRAQALWLVALYEARFWGKRFLREAALKKVPERIQNVLFCIDQGGHGYVRT